MPNRIVVLKSGGTFTGKHIPNWMDFDRVYKVTETGVGTILNVGDTVKVPRDSISYVIMKKAHTK